MSEIEKIFCYLVGVDELHIKEGKAVCKFIKESPRYTIYAEALAFIEEYNCCSLTDRKFLIESIKKIYNSFNHVINQANDKYSLKNSLSFEYDIETSKIIQELQKIIKVSGKNNNLSKSHIWERSWSISRSDFYDNNL